MPRGGGTGLAGGATPQGARLNVIVSFERMRRIRSVDSVGDVMIVEAGCTLHEVQAAAAAAGRLIGIDHGGAGSSQIGGNLSTNAGGNNVLRYGMARDQVLGLEVVLADGRVLSRLSSLRKSNAGYDLKQLFLGSEGTLGLITAAALRLHPAPVKRATACVGVASAEATLDFFARARAALGELISACELMSKICVDLHLRHRQEATLAVGRARRPGCCYWRPTAPAAISTSTARSMRCSKTRWGRALSSKAPSPPAKRNAKACGACAKALPRP